MGLLASLPSAITDIILTFSAKRAGSGSSGRHGWRENTVIPM